MSQSLREAVTAQLMRVEIMPAPPQQPAALPAMEAHKIDPTTGEDEMALAMAGAETLARHGIGGRGGPAGGPGLVSPGLASPGLGGPGRSSGLRPCSRNSRRRGGDAQSARPASWGKIGRNEPCPCGSGKKYKHCHGRYS